MPDDPELEAAWAQVLDSMSAHARAGETKKRRTREKLIQAADHVMREQGMSATVEAIAEEAGVSVPTFYNFYRSRNDLCSSAFDVLVLDQAQLADQRGFKATADLFVQLCQERPALVRAGVFNALTEHQEDSESYGGHIPGPPQPRSYPHLDQFISTDGLDGRLAYLLIDDDIASQAVPTEDDTRRLARIATALMMAASQLLIAVASVGQEDTAMLEDIVRMACWLEPRR